MPDLDPDLRVSVVGDRAVCGAWRAALTVEVQTRLLALGRRLREGGRYEDVVPGWGNLTVVIDPRRDELVRVQAQLLQAWHEVSDVALPPPRERVLRVRYGGEHGPDLAECAARAGLSETAFIDRHSAAVYTVAFLGFQPGFAYLMGLPEPLHQPRRAEPRVRVPAGSVAIGGAQAGVYPSASPGGWQLIGRTDQGLFDPHAADPAQACWLQPGDRVRFRP
ncbi:MAG: 5-oxoprolinase subunit PxpB [Inhella sp.]|jgi:KipI family sensor histidine kinase inhibitor|uniref:5-oxoprolinase subunit PxpB n=1 Tax=Inhella sp. TaxID=1921806 RepID=UPI0022CB6178|nr:5-oxoprolinase subunit PxpB [Inhella sp.]MCZ8233630.1 5-oxoprolinase subunit PxpB [Inhella sp.]